jgi:hypothetical protein
MKPSQSADFRLFVDVVGADPTPEAYYRFSEALARQSGTGRPCTLEIARALREAARGLGDPWTEAQMGYAAARLEGVP